MPKFRKSSGCRIWKGFSLLNLNLQTSEPVRQVGFATVGQRRQRADYTPVSTDERLRRMIAEMARTGKDILLLRKTIAEMGYPDNKRRRIVLAEMVVLQRRRTRSIIELLAAMGVSQPPRSGGDLLFPTSDDMYAVYQVADTTGALTVSPEASSSRDGE